MTDTQFKPLVVTPELSVKLKEAGYPQKDSMFYWVKKAGGFSLVDSLALFYRQFKSEVISAAPTCQELGQNLPVMIQFLEGGQSKDKYEVNLYFGSDSTQAWYRDREYGTCPCGCGSFYEKSYLACSYDKEVDNRADLWLKIKSIENKFKNLNL